MKQIEFFYIDSPCRGICKVNSHGYCLGCARSRNERFNWLNLSDAEKKDVLRLCQERFKRARRKKVKQEKKDYLTEELQVDMFEEE